jgi:hypothetical protein
MVVRQHHRTISLGPTLLTASSWGNATYFFLTYLHAGHEVSGFPQRITIVGQGRGNPEKTPPER